jgi:hypothetical protein
VGEHAAGVGKGSKRRDGRVEMGKEEGEQAGVRREEL